MLGKATKNIVLGNVQLLEYCKQHSIDHTKLRRCNIEKMGDKYFFVMPKKNVVPSLSNDIDSQPDVVLTMDAGSDIFYFENTKWTSAISI